MTETPPTREIAQLRKELRIYRSIVVAAVCAGLAFLILREPLRVATKQADEMDTQTHALRQKILPHYSRIMGIIQPLRYSGLHTLLRDDVDVRMDFTAQTWTISNVHRFDEQGQLELEEGRDGLCGELSAYTAAKIRPFLGPGYSIKFARVAESGFFLSPQASHVVLLIAQGTFNSSEVCLLDPSLKRYGKADDFGDYLFFEVHDEMPFVKARKSDETFSADSGTPLLINRDILLHLQAERVEGRFDRDNFALALSATRRYKYAGRYVCLVRCLNGNLEVFENEILARKLLDRQEYERLRGRLLSWVKANHANSENPPAAVQ